MRNSKISNFRFKLKETGKTNINLLVAKVARGSESDFESLFLLYYPRLEKYAEKILQNKAEAEDLVQNVFIQIWNNRDSLNAEKHFASYIFKLVKNRCLNLLKRKLVEEKYINAQSNIESEQLYDVSFEVEGDFSSMQDRFIIELEKVIKKMPERCQVAFRLKWFESKKNREIADIMGISTTMVDKHIAKGLQIARQNITPENLRAEDNRAFNTFFLLLIFNLQIFT